MGAKSRAARKIRESKEFNAPRLAQPIDVPKDGRGSPFSWTLADIRAARDAQMRGQFRLAADMAKAMRTDDAIATAWENRLAPQRCIKVKLIPAGGARGKPIAAEAEALFGQKGVGIHPDSIADVHGCLVDHGIAFGYNVATPREDGTRVDFEMRYWPIEYVRWDSFLKLFIARIDPETAPPGEATADGVIALGSFEVPIIHGDGRWIIFKKHEIDPFTKEAAILPACLVWARHAFALRDWAKGSVAHGSAKVIGKLADGVALQGDGPNGLSAEAAAFQTFLRDLVSGDTPAGIAPAGSETDFITNNSMAWQVWNELVQNAEKAAARIYLGTDGTLGTQGGAPGVDIESLFGVASTKIEGDLRCIERGLLTGVIEPWCALNFGDSSLAPSREYQVPDGDEAAAHEDLAKRTAAFGVALKALVDARIAITQDYVNGLAADFKVRAPVLVVAPAVTTPDAAPGAALRAIR